MKKITVLLLTLFSLAAMAVQADDYIPLVEQGKVWKYAGHIYYYEYLDPMGTEFIGKAIFSR